MFGIKFLAKLCFKMLFELLIKSVLIQGYPIRGDSDRDEYFFHNNVPLYDMMVWEERLVNSAKLGEQQLGGRQKRLGKVGES